MNISTTTSAPTSPHRHAARNVIVAAVGATLALAALAAAGAWSHIDSGGSGASTSVQGPASPVTSGQAHSHPSTRLFPPTFYIVGSAEQAAAVEVSLSEANAIRNGG